MLKYLHVDEDSSDANFLYFRARNEFPLGIIGGSQSPKNILKCKV